MLLKSVLVVVNAVLQRLKSAVALHRLPWSITRVAALVHRCKNENRNHAQQHPHHSSPECLVNVSLHLVNI